MAYATAEARNAYFRMWYAANKKRHISYVARNKKVYSDWLFSLKVGKSCRRCREDHPACLDFHHKRRTRKSFSIGEAYARQYERARVLKEIKKCEILCSNCHRKEHFVMRCKRVAQLRAS
jgi:hypothetical protein